MVTREEFAALALALPEATPGSHFGQPDFRVRGKIFCGLDRAAARGSLKIRKDVQALLLESRGEAFSAAAGAWGESGWTYVELTHVARDELRELVTDAWRLVAPARLVALHAGRTDAASELVITVSAKTSVHPERPGKKKRTRAMGSPAARASKKSNSGSKRPRSEGLKRPK